MFHFTDLGIEAQRRFEEQFEPNQQVIEGPGFKPESLVQGHFHCVPGPYAQPWASRLQSDRWGLEIGGLCSLHGALAVTLTLQMELQAPCFQANKRRLREAELSVRVPTRG